MIDFRSVVTHELGHSLGFIDSYWPDPADPYDDWGNAFGDASDPGTWLGWLGLTQWDQNLIDDAGNRPQNGTTGTPFNFNQLDDPIYWTGTAATAIYGSPVPVYAPNPYEIGSSLAHVDGLSGALMNPSIGLGVMHRQPLPVEWAMMGDMGWTLAGAGGPYVWNTTSGPWVTSGNWTPAGPPGAVDTARFVDTGGGSVDLGGATHSVDTLELQNAVGNDFTFTNGTLSLNTFTQTGTGTNTFEAILDSASIAGSVSAGRLELNNTGNTIAGGTWTVSGGTLLAKASGTQSGLGSANVILSGGTLELAPGPATTLNGIDETIFDGTISNAQDNIEAFRAATGSLGASDGQGVLTGHLHYNDDNAVSNRAAALGASGFNNENFAMLWVTEFTPSEDGAWGFRFNRVDDNASLWIDDDQNGVFEATGDRFYDRGCCGGSGDRLTPVLTANQTYLLGFVMNDTGGGGHFRDMEFKAPSGSWTNFDPAANSGLFAVDAVPGANLANNVSVTANSAIRLGTTLPSATLGNLAMGADTQLTVHSVDGGQPLEFTGNTTLSGGTATFNTTGGALLTLNNVGETAASNLTKTGDGTLILPTANTYTGQTNANAGVVQVSVNDALGTTAAGTVVAGGASLRLVGGFNYGSPEGLSISGSGNAQSDGALHSASGDNDYRGPITLGGNAVIRNSANRLRLYGGVDTAGSEVTFRADGGNIELHGQPVTGSGSVRKEGNNTLIVMNGSNSNYTGPTVIADGELDARDNDALGTAAGGTTVANDATLTIRDGRTLADDVSITGNGHNGRGAIRNENNTNTMTGAISVGGSARIHVNDTQLTLSGQVTGGSIDKTGTGTLVLTDATNSYSSVALNEGALRIANAGALGGTTGLSVDSGQALEFDGTMTIDNTNLATLAVNDGSLRGISGTTTIDTPIGLGIIHDVTFGGNGNLVVNQPFGNGGATTTPDALWHYGYHVNNDGLALDLDSNGGMMGGGDPTTFQNFYGQALLINGPGNRGLDFDDDADFINTGAIGQNDNYSNLWVATLHVDPGEAGNWEFRNAGDDDRAGIWLDLDQDGVFQSSTPGLGSNRGEQLSWEDGGTKTVTLAAGDYLIGFTHREGGGGSRADFRFRSPSMGGQVIIKPGDAAQSGIFLSDVTPDNNVIKNGNGVLTLAGDNTFNGSVTINAGTVVAAHNNAFGVDGGGIAMKSGASLGFSGGVTVDGENVSGADGRAAGQPGTIVNLDGNNAFLGNIAASMMPGPAQELSIASQAGTLTVGTAGAGNTLELNFNRLAFSGAGNTVVNSDISGLTGSQAVDAVEAFVFDGNTFRDPGAAEQFQALYTDQSLRLTDDNGFRGLFSEMVARDQWDNYGATFTGELVIPDRLGGGTAFNVEFGTEHADDGNRIWVDLDHNGLFETGGAAGNELLIDRGCCGNAYSTISITPGSYAFMVQSREGGGGSSVQPQIDIGDGSGRQFFDPGNMAGGVRLQTTFTPNNELVKTGTGTVTLAGNNSYSGATSVLEGTLVAASNNALGTPGAGTTVADGATLGLQGGVTITGEALTLGNVGPAGEPGLLNLSGNNTYAGKITVAKRSLGEAGIRSQADLLVIAGDVDLQYSKLTVSGDGNTTIAGVISGYGANFAQFTPGGLNGNYYDVNNAPNNRNTDPDLLNPIATLEALTPAVTVRTPRVDFGTGTETTQGDGTVLDRGGYDSGSVPSWQGLFNDLGIATDMDGDQIAGLWTGYIMVPEDATYRFTTRSDDGSVLLIDDALVVDNNYWQGMTNRSGDISLTAGAHKIKVGFYEGGGGAGVQASWEQLDGSAFGRQIIGPDVLGDYEAYDTDNSLIKTGTGTLTLSGDNTYKGTTQVLQGKLLVNGSHTGGAAYTVAPGATLGGIGSTDAPVTLGGTMAPGNSIGTFTTGNETWLDNASFTFEIDDATGTAGQENGPGWDLLVVDGILDLQGLSSEGFEVDIVSLLSGGGTNPGAVDHFSADPGLFYVWDFVHAGEILGFEAGDFVLDAGAFANPIDNVFGDGEFGIRQTGNNLEITFEAAVPEPSTFVLAALGPLGLGLLGRRRLRRKHAD